MYRYRAQTLKYLHKEAVNVHYERASQTLHELLQKSLKKVRKTETKDKLSRHISFEISQLRQLGQFQGMYKYMSIYYDAPHSLLTYMPENTVVFIDEMSRVKEMAESLHKEDRTSY